MRRRYKTSSPCVNGAGLLRTAGELSGSAIRGPFEVFAPISLPAVRVDLLSVEEVTFEGSDHRVAGVAKIAGVARVAKIIRITRIADERPALVGIGRKSRRNTESLAGMHQPPVDLMCLQGASTAGMRQPPGGGK